MEFREIVQRRRMVRSFLDHPVDAGSVDRILDCARRGPSAGFSQGFEFLVLEGPEQTGRYWDATFQPEDRHDFEWAGLLRAPLIIVPLAHKQAYLDRYAQPDKGWFDKDEAHWPVPYWLVDTSFAALLILLAVVDEGLGAVFFGIQEGGSDRFRQAFSVPEEYSPIGAVAIGYPVPDDRSASSPRPRRRPLEQIVHRGHW
jgi:nitroreductase